MIGSVGPRHHRLADSEADRITTMLEAARFFAKITAESIAQTDVGFTLPQLRVLVLASENEPLSSSAVAIALDIHLSNASRLCDRLVRPACSIDATVRTTAGRSS